MNQRDAWQHIRAIRIDAPSLFGGVAADIRVSGVIASRTQAVALLRTVAQFLRTSVA